MSIRNSSTFCTIAILIRDIEDQVLVSKQRSGKAEDSRKHQNDPYALNTRFDSLLQGLLTLLLHQHWDVIQHGSCLLGRSATGQDLAFGTGDRAGGLCCEQSEGEEREEESEDCWREEGEEGEGFAGQVRREWG